MDKGNNTPIEVWVHIHVPYWKENKYKVYYKIFELPIKALLAKRFEIFLGGAEYIFVEHAPSTFRFYGSEYHLHLTTPADNSREWDEHIGFAFAEMFKTESWMSYSAEDHPISTKS